MSDEKIIQVKPDHIDRGIEKYNGKKVDHLNSLLKNAGLPYTAYRFNDGRILVVIGDKTAAFLYQNENHLFQSIDLE